MTDEPLPRIFISYRRADNAEFVERIRDWLLHRYGRTNVFMDFDAIPPFVKFADYIRERIRISDAVIVIIGPRWMELLQAKQKSGDEDLVRIEIEQALSDRKVIAPILIKGGQMPRRADLPASLQPLCDYNAASLEGGQAFYDSIERIMQALEASIASQRPAAAEPNGTPAQMMPPALVGRLKLAAERAVQRGAELHEAGDYAGAVEAYSEAIHYDPLNALAYNNRGLAKRLMGDFDGAIADYTASIEKKNPELYLPYYNRGLVLLALRQYARAERDLRQALALNHPEPHLIHYDLAMAREGQGDHQGAMAEYTEAIRLKPDYAEAHNNRGVLRAEQGDEVGAMGDYVRSIALGNSEPHLPYFNRGMLRMKRGDLSGAVSDFEQAIKLRPDFEIARTRLAEAKVALGTR